MNNSSLATTSDSPFHLGEQKIQEQEGVRDKMERFGRQVIRDFLPEQHRDFYTQLPFVFVGHADQQGWPWASMLFNGPGFITSNTEKELLIKARPVPGDPLAGALNNGTRIGLLGIDLETRRRNRVAGQISQVSKQGVELSISQAFGNCPQYIQSRELQYIEPASMPPAATKVLTEFDQQAVDLISNSDTFFVASYVANMNNSASEGVDVSHRGGKPGFIRVDDKQTLTIPDYVGNFHFNTLGNFLQTPKAGLLFIDFTQGHMLTLTGSVEILWDSPDTEFFTGAERLWTFHIDHGYWLKNVLPLRWKLQQYSPNTMLTGNWQDAKAAKKADELKHTWQTYRVTKIVEESSMIKSFYLQPPADQKPNFLPGQFLTIKANIDKQAQIRTYTVSNAPADNDLRISVKHEQANGETPAGIFSSFLHQQINVGDVINAKAPDGAFTLDATNQHPAVLMSAGVGITPMIAMVRHVLQEAIRTRSIRPVTLICFARNHAQRAFFTELNEICQFSKGQIQVIWVLSQPEQHLHLGTEYHYQGRLSTQQLQDLLPQEEADFYLCGPNGFMQSQYDMLRELGVSNAHIYAESFGPAALVRDQPLHQDLTEQLTAAEEAVVTFSESGFEQAWSTGDGTLLEFSEAHGLTPNYGCRNGQCGTCKVKRLSGAVTYKQAISAPITKDEILLCCAFPAVEAGKNQSHLEIKL